MKVKHFVFSIIAVAFLSSAISVDKDLKIGATAPKIETITGKNVGNDANPDKKMKLVSFWSPKNAASRIANKNLENLYSVHQQEEIEFISICTDSDEALMQEVIKMDGINPESVYAHSEISPRVFKDYGVEENPKAFMISPEGKILSIL